MRGVAIRAVQEMMGHASIVITQRYAAQLAPEVSRRRGAAPRRSRK
jgi:site-specific recombinase XerD